MRRMKFIQVPVDAVFTDERLKSPGGGDWLTKNRERAAHRSGGLFC